ncbi:MAG: hypothetical protein CM15mP118_1870 [Alphaproteobacteria bacterium]|nr:MAG: hypothetical protein CM15mP118_1870 [Alphaproteobacteria bacterium]
MVQFTLFQKVMEEAKKNGKYASSECIGHRLKRTTLN